MDVNDTLRKATLGSSSTESLGGRMSLPFEKGFFSILPVQSILAPLLASVTGGNNGMGSSWLVLLIFTCFSGFSRSLWTVFNPLERLLGYAYIDSIHEHGDLSYTWLLHYWQNHPSYEHSRSFVTQAGNGVRNDPNRQARINRRNPRRRAPVGATPKKSQGAAETLELLYKPKDTESFWFWRGWKLYRMSHTVRELVRYPGMSPEKTGTIAVRCFSLDREPLVSLLHEAKDLHTKLRPSMLSIHVYDPTGDWWRVAALKPKRPLSSIRMEETEKQHILDDATDFFASEQWYAERGIPWRRGYMLHGSPGTGKTSTIHALASELDLPVYVLPLSSNGLSDYTLACALRQIQERSLLLLEDIDVATASMKRNLGETPVADKAPVGLGGGSTRSSHSGGLTLSALLNCIDGMDSSEGRLLVMTSNDLASLDPALIRPGRCDLFFEYRKATREQAKQLFTRFYGDLSTARKHTAIEHVCGDKSHVDLEELGALWANQLEDYEFSMASLQGMLLQHRKDPHAAVQKVAGWMKVEREALRTKNESKETVKGFDDTVLEGTKATL